MKNFKEFKEETKNGANERAAKERIKRERNNDAMKFDRIMDRAKIADAKAKAQMSKPEKVSEEVKSYTMQPDLDRLLNRVMYKKSYEKAIRFYLDLRRKAPGKARANAMTATKATGADFRNFEMIFHQMIRDGKLPKHLAWNKQLLNKKTLVQKIKDKFK
jgi:hypothetical protein